MWISRSSSAEEVYEYLKKRCSELVQSYPAESFRGVDGEVFFGLSEKSIDMALPMLSDRDKGLLLARSASLRSPSTLRNVTPPPTFTPVQEEQPPVIEVKKPRPVMPLLGQLPRILIEVWHGSSEHERTDFLAETWIPNLQEFELSSETLLLALKRSIRDRDSRSIVSSRKWFGSLVASMRYHRIDNRLDLFVGDARDLQFGGDFGSENEFFLKIFSFVPSTSLSLIHITDRISASQATVVEFGAHVTVKFGSSDDPSVVAAKKISETTSDSPKRPLMEPSVLKAIMLKDPFHPSPVISPIDSKFQNLVCLYDLLSYSAKEEFYQFNPKYHRFDSYLLPTHEMSAITGAEYQIRNQTQLDALRGDEQYMRAHTQVVELLLISWGLGKGEESGKGSWTGHSWLFRQALLSSILLQNNQALKRLISAGKTLGATRQIDASEDGFGEALFTLMENESEAKRFWENNSKLRGCLKSPYIPPIRTSLGQLLHWS